MTPWSKCKTVKSQHMLAVSPRFRGMRKPTTEREEQAASCNYRPAKALDMTSTAEKLVSPKQLLCLSSSIAFG